MRQNRPFRTTFSQPVFLSSVVESGASGRDVEERVEGRLHGVEGPLDQLHRHLDVLTHLADVAQLKHCVDVKRVVVQ